ncbi:hypothetical protein, partial [Alkalihalobacillus deserti]|uniref:hypothetical protein n=1 Tax=Alkalihalobacillus deserti TaxID=2879466 RepID=UPI001D154BDB
CSVTGTIANFCWGIRKAPPLFNTCIVPGGAAYLYALFEWGLTLIPFIFIENKNLLESSLTKTQIKSAWIIK